MKSFRQFRTRLRMKLPPALRPVMRLIEQPGPIVSRPWRLATARWRALPDFLVLGVHKGGSSSFYYYLVQHPQVRAAMKKEIYFFGRRYDKGARWYRSRFPLRSSLRPDRITGEATPTYIAWPHAPRLIHETVPDAKLMVVLRNPTQRAISHYFYSVQWRQETLPILDALRAEEERLAPHLARSAGDQRYFHPNLGWFSYQHRGHYAEQIERFYEQFGRDRLLIVDNRELAEDTVATMRRAYAFLGIDPDFTPPDLERLAVGHNRRAVDDAVVAHLDAHFRPHNARLAALIGRDLGW